MLCLQPLGSHGWLLSSCLGLQKGFLGAPLTPQTPQNPKTPLQPMQVQHQRVSVSAPGQQLLFRPKNHVRLRQEAEMPSGLSMMSMEVKPISHWSELALTPRNPSPEDHERIEEQSPQQQLWVFYFAFPLTTLALVNGRDLFTTWRHFQRLWLRSKAEIRH